MPTTGTALALAAAVLFAALMGASIQRGATCTVAAVDELVNHRRSTRLRSLAEAAVWVGVGLLLARSAGLLVQWPGGHALGWQTLLGGALLGGGAYLNRACVFGAIARLSSGEWAYAATPVGFYAGCHLFLKVGHGMSPPALQAAPPIMRLPPEAACALGALIVLRIGWGSWRSVTAAPPAGQAPASRLSRALASLWSPGPATLLIGLSFLAMMLLAGPWAYTELLADWARDMAGHASMRALLAVSLLAGAGIGGWRAGKWRPVAPRPALLLRCFCGGALMGFGSLFIPGGNDGLILVGMPLLWPYAWVAFASMALAIAWLMWLANRWEWHRCGR